MTTFAEIRIRIELPKEEAEKLAEISAQLQQQWRLRDFAIPRMLAFDAQPLSQLQTDEEEFISDHSDRIAGAADVHVERLIADLEAAGYRAWREEA